MSRTYRKGHTWKYHVNGEFIEWHEVLNWRAGITLGWCLVGVRERQRDGNPNDMTSPPRWFKQQHRQEERRAQNAAVRDGKEMPRFRTRDRYDWW